MSLTPQELQAYSNLLQSIQRPDDLTPDQKNELLLKGILVTLESDASPHAVQSIYAAAGHPLDSVRALALQCLQRLALSENTAVVPNATGALYRLSVEHDNLVARQFVETHPALTGQTSPTLRILYTFLFGAAPLAAEEELALLTRAYFDEASHNLRRRLLYLAPEKGMQHWAAIVTTEEQFTADRQAEQAAEALLTQYPTFTEAERRVVIQRLAQLAAHGLSIAQDTLARVFVRHIDPLARQIALEHGYLPADSEQRALFFFLAEAWPQYESLDFDHALLTAAYESGSRALRRRLLDHSRRTGHLEWLRGLSSANELRWPADLTDADWELALNRLSSAARPLDLWRLAQVAPPIWSARMVDHLAEADWLPDQEDERPYFAALRSLARECLANPLSARPRKRLQAPAPLNCLALNPSNTLLAAGSAEQHIYTWLLPDGLLRQPPLSGPAPVVRALAFSPDGSLLAAAAGDHRIRIFRLQDGAVVKTLEGHKALVRSLVIHPEGRLLASAGFDGTIRLWRFPFGPELKTIHAGRDEIFSLALSADGRYLLSAGADRQVSVWSLPDGSPVRQLNRHADTITNLAASPESDLVASAGRDSHIRLWNFSSGGLARSIQHTGQPLSALCLHRNEHILIGAAQNGGEQADILLWNISTGKLIDRLSGHREAITGLEIAAGGDELYSCDRAGHLLIWDLRTLLTVYLAGEIDRPGSAAALQERLKAPGLSPAEKKWLSFTAELARYRQRFDIELAEYQPISVGDFDIEL